MYVLTRATDYIVRKSREGNNYSVEVLFYSIILYINGIFNEKVHFSEFILAISISEYVVVVLSTGLHMYEYSETKGLKCIQIIPIEEIVAADAVDEYILLSTLSKDIITTTLYNANTSIEFTVESIEGKKYEEPRIFIERKSEHETVICIEYSKHKRYICDINNDFFEDTEDTHRTKFFEENEICKYIFIDKRNLLKISGQKVVHMKMNMHREIACVHGFIKVLKNTHGIEVLTKEEKYIVCRRENKYILQRTLIKQTVGIEKEGHADENILLTEPESSRKSSMSVLLSSSLFTYTCENYVHQLHITGMIKIFMDLDGNLIYLRSIGPVHIFGLTGFYCFSTHNSSLVVLVYSSQIKVFEYSPALKIESEIHTASRIETVERFRKEILVKCRTGYIKYFLNKQKALKGTDFSFTGDEFVSLAAPNMNVQHTPVTITKASDGVVSVLWNDSVIVKGTYISCFHLLHSGYVYASGFQLVLNSKSIYFSYAICSLSVYNTPTRSTVLVHLITGSLHLLSVDNGAVVGRVDMPYKLSSERLVMLSLDSFMSIARNTLTIFGGDEYIQPILRVSFPGQIKDVCVAEDNIMVVTNKEGVYSLQKSNLYSKYNQNDSGFVGAFCTDL
ncbi:hypothetical protein NEAUS03_1062 [Nematocida ausubeli]|nr:hypothetical protein NEAUS03_1062 [Nematocida ausubeli]